MTFQRKAVAVVGATASGKSAVAHQVALELAPQVEIICVDAMTVYREMNIGTAKPTLKERSEVTYHLVDVVNPDEEFTVAEFQRQARRVATEIWSRGHAVLYVGGTGLYGRAIIDDFEIPGQYPEIRQSLEAEAEVNVEALHAELVKKDPVAAAKMESNNARRIIRALEVVRGSGKAFSSFGDEMSEYKQGRVCQVGLSSTAEGSKSAVAERFKTWLEEGLLEEVRALSARPAGLSRTARQAVGYRELLMHVEHGIPLDECIEDALRASRQLARRQRAWFRRDPRIEWFDNGESAKLRLIALLQSDASLVRD